ncbi:protein suppressor of hairy wing-like [Zophobas morio]|uniref:protein suppressor of hairy wing-like n=1 Tax=Zophobas morio TaxID=2755281 RepID=UPI0030834E8E
MTMYTLPNFCRVCLKYDKNLIDLEHIENEPSETLMSKLQQCVSEVEWKVFKPLLCHPCIKRLNIAYMFKKQCVQSATMLKSYVALLTKNKESESSKNDAGQSNAYMMLPNQKYIKIVVGPQNQNTYQNVFLNVVPTPSLNPIGSPENTKSKDTNQNVFLNINNTFQKYVPMSPESSKNLSVSQLLTESKSEELSVEIDPTDFGLGDECCSEDDESQGENGVNDWEDVISAMKIASRTNGTPNGKHAEAKGSFSNYVPILPKQDDNFSSSGEHFLSPQLFSSLDFNCETCQKQFSSRVTLKHHIKNFHMGKFPFKCDYCCNQFIVRAEYEACMKYHKGESDPLDTSLTLNDFKNEPPPSERPATEQETTKESTDLTCEICHRQFNSPSGLLRHKVRKHNQKSKKKYFIKGMKNAKCDICNREFSTQSYMQLHRKLHLRDDIGYKYKVFGRNRYAKGEEEKEKVNVKKETESDEEKVQDVEKKSDNQDDNKMSNNEEEMEIEMDIVKEEPRVEEESTSDNGSEN